MPRYDAALFTPAAPLALVTLRSQGTAKEWEDVPMLIDTGADVTVIPRTALDRLDLAEAAGKGYEVVGFDGAKSIVAVVDAELVFCRRRFRGQFLLGDQPWGILGRNVLNAVPLLLDGPRLEWAEHIAPER